jgi:hypothetical protein
MIYQRNEMSSLLDKRHNNKFKRQELINVLYTNYQRAKMNILCISNSSNTALGCQFLTNICNRIEKSINQ